MSTFWQSLTHPHAAAEVAGLAPYAYPRLDQFAKYEAHAHHQ